MDCCVWWKWWVHGGWVDAASENGVTAWSDGSHTPGQGVHWVQWGKGRPTQACPENNNTSKVQSSISCINKYIKTNWDCISKQRTQENQCKIQCVCVCDNVQYLLDPLYPLCPLSCPAFPFFPEATKAVAILYKYSHSVIIFIWKNKKIFPFGFSSKCLCKPQRIENN